jgi:YD repeat-containing protein
MKMRNPQNNNTIVTVRYIYDALGRRTEEVDDENCQLTIVN